MPGDVCRHGCRDPGARPDQRARPRLRARQPRAGRRSRSPWPSWAAEPVELTHTIGGERRDGRRQEDRRPPAARHAARCSARCSNATAADAAGGRRRRQGGRPRLARAVLRRPRRVLLKAADLLAGPWRATLNAATMLGQSKTCYQAEIDAACELIDFWRLQRPLRPADPRRAAAAQRQGRLEPHRPPPARGLRLRDHAVQLHRHRAATCRPRRP